MRVIIVLCMNGETKSIRLLLVDDHAIFRQGVKGLLASTPDLQVVAEAGNYLQAVEMLRTTRINGVVADLSMPGRDGIELISHIKTTNPGIPILILTMHQDLEYASRALRSGASGYLTKAATSDELVSAIRRIASGRMHVCSTVSEILLSRFTRSGPNRPPHATLSPREFRVFELLAQCWPLKRIACELSLSVKTVGTHKMRLLKKMKLNHQAELVRYAIEHDLASS